MAKYETAFKLKVVKSFLAGEGGAKLLARRWSGSEEKIRTWLSHYRLHGIDSLRPKRSVYTEIVPDATKRTLQAIIRGRADIASIMHTDRWRGYDGLVDVGFDKHFRVNHGNNEFARGSNGIESFWSYAKRRLVKFNGVPRHTFYLHLKETEFRFNHRHQSVYKALLSLLRSNPL